jgi:hypothetical protein
MSRERIHRLAKELQEDCMANADELVRLLIRCGYARMVDVQQPGDLYRKGLAHMRSERWELGIELMEEAFRGYLFETFQASRHKKEEEERQHRRNQAYAAAMLSEAYQKIGDREKALDRVALALSLFDGFGEDLGLITKLWDRWNDLVETVE